ncbi:MAG: hypothetical protein PWR16_931 [Methanoculleus sp.]|nr:hypothetical protein [Methanoculleus sp.]
METRSRPDARQKCFRNSGKRFFSEMITQMSPYASDPLPAHERNETSSMARRRSATMPLPNVLPYIMVPVRSGTRDPGYPGSSGDPLRDPADPEKDIYGPVR